MSDITLRLAEACERAEGAIDCHCEEQHGKPCPQCVEDMASLRALAAALRGARPDFIEDHKSERHFRITLGDA